MRYKVDIEEAPCVDCGKGGSYSVTDVYEGIGCIGGAAFDYREEAAWLCRLLNEAFEAGRKAGLPETTAQRLRREEEFPDFT
jgi:hypothetical protein